MKCNKCGAERQKYQLDEGGCRTAETLPQCRDAISAQLASMTKRAEDLERANANYVEMTKGAIGHASDDADRASFNLRRAEAAEAKLTTAQKNYFDLCDAVCRESVSVEDACRQARETRAKLATAVEALRRVFMADEERAWKIQGAFSNSERVVDRAESLIEFITEQACYPLPYGGVFRERVQHLIAALAAARKETP